MKRLLFLSFILFIGIIAGFGAGANGSIKNDTELLRVFDYAEKTIRVEGNYSKALDLYLTFISGAENKESLRNQLLTSYISVAVIYGSFNDLENAIVYNKAAYRLARKLNNTEFAELALTNLAQSYKGKHDFTGATVTADSLLAFGRGRSKTVLFHYSIIKGEIAQLQGKHGEALTFFRRAEKASRAPGFSEYEKSAPLSLIAEHYKNIDRPDSQLVYLNKAWQLLEPTHDPQPKAEAARSLMMFHARHGDMNEMRRFQEIYFALTDSLVNPEQFHSVSTRHQEQRIAEKRDEIKLLNREAFRHRLIIGVIAGLLLLSLIFLYFILRQKRTLRDAYQALFDKNMQLMAFQSESETAAKPAVTHQPNHEEDAEDDERNRELFERIVREMESSADYLNPDFGLSNLVVKAESNAAYVSKVVKLCSGQNVPSLINEYRIREACRRLLDEENYGNLTFGAIGESVGFSSQVSFNRAFKKVTGMTPRLYRKMGEAEKRKS